MPNTKIHGEFILLAAQAAHEVNRTYCLAIGDSTQPEWNDSPEWQRESATKGVIFQIANPDSPPSASHESWLEQKTRDGWVYGPTKDAELRQHPCMVPFDQLPVAQQTKDILFVATVRGVIANCLAG